MRRTGTKPTSFFVNGWAIAHRGTVCRFSSLQLEHKKALLEKIGKELKILDLQGWYGVSRQEVMKRGGRSLFAKHSSLERLLRALYPAFSWDSAKFAEIGGRVPHGFWANVTNQRSMLDKIGKELGIKKEEDWYAQSRLEVAKRGAQGLFRIHDTLCQALQHAYPEFTWDASKFSEVERQSPGFWSDVKNQRELMDKIGKDLGIKQFSDWYLIRRSQVNDRGGKVLFVHYRSLAELLGTVYPEHEWDITKFLEAGLAPKGYWRNKQNLVKALDKAEQTLGITKPEDWYSITLADLGAIGFSNSVTKPMLAELLEERYPGHHWEKVYLLRGRYAQQKRLENAVDKLFPGIEIIRNARKEAGVLNPTTNAHLELDVFIPSLQLGFEYQERHHYTTSDYVYKPVEDEKRRDSAKRNLVAEKGITLVVVPCWWDGKVDSLAASIKRIRPDVLKDDTPIGKEIPESPPTGFFDKQIPTVEGIGQPTSACFFTQTSTDPTNWWLFEKYDGVRGFWNPEKKAFYSRQGNTFTLPQEIIDSMPNNLFLDGELWFGVDNFQEASKLFKKVDPGVIDWSKFRYMVYDIPTHKGSYSERYNEIVTYFASRPSKYVEVATKMDCKGLTHVEQFFQDIVDRGGEGIILRDPKALMQSGRSPGYLKHKRFRDAEAKVVSSVGQHQWECELPNGIRFVAPAGTTEFVKRWDPQPGDIVSFKHHGYLISSKKPKLPTIYRIRTDIAWADVVNNWKEQKYSPSGLPVKRARAKYQPKRYWQDMDNRRKFLCDFAQEMGFDPYQPKNWDNVSVAQIIAKKGTTLILNYQGSLLAALKDTFPELTFTTTERVKKGHWKDIDRVRKYFDEIAKHRGFDPTEVSKWEDLKKSDLLPTKGIASLLSIYGGMKGALRAAYPELPFRQYIPGA